jgi:aspartate-semialdehyde dehydrogenase
MSSPSKPSFAIVGGATLLGKELREVIEALPSAVDVRLIGTGDVDASGLTSDGDEAVVLSPLNESSLSESTVVFLAGDERSSQLAWDLVALRKQRPFLVDMSGTLDRVPQAQLRAPLVEAPGFEVLPNAVQVLAHPASIALAILLQRLGTDLAPSRLIAHTFLPVSEQGNAGINELHQQTVNLLGFQTLPRNVFGGQLAFNMMASIGPEASAGNMRKIEVKVQTELPRLLGSAPVPQLSVRCVQAPVFHCFSQSLRLEFPSAIDQQRLAETLKGGLVDLWSEEQGAPDQLSAVGETGVVIGDLRPDGPDGTAYWLWLVADNLRLRAASAVATARIWLS